MSRKPVFLAQCAQRTKQRRHDGIRRTGRAVAGLLLVASLSACITKYPHSEKTTELRFPLPLCDAQTLAMASADSGATKTREGVDPKSLCVTAPFGSAGAEAKSDQEKRQLEAQAFSRAEALLRDKLEPPFVASAAAPRFGLALSGGGSKASAFTVGVMAGLSDHGLLDRADFISTVSGGGYAAYYYYAHRIFPLVRSGQGAPPATEDLYRDCVGMPEPQSATAEVIQSIKQVNHCPRLGLNSISPKEEHVRQDIRYQAFQKCTQDVLRPGMCDTRTTGGFDWGVSKISLAGSLVLFPFSNIANTLFDWGYSTSPSGRTYRDGIGIGNGATVVQASALPKGQAQQMQLCHPDRIALGEVRDCAPNVFDPDPVPMTFDELRTGLSRMNSQPGPRIPFWIINATAPKHRSAFGWLARSREDTSNSDMFEMTAVSHGSGRYGYVSAPVSIYDMTVLDAVAASAAFLDSNQLVYQNRVTKAIAGIGLHVANLDWGYDIPNYNVSTGRRRLHRALPAPLYYADGYLAVAGEQSQELRDRGRSVYIRLIDGGNSENLGVYSLIKRKTRNIVISDAAQDQNGLFGDICGLKRRLSQAPEGLPRYLYVPGLGSFDEHCNQVDSKEGQAYGVYHWTLEQPVLLGCVRHIQAQGQASEACSKLGENDTRLFILKPAIDYPRFVANQLTKGPRDRKVSRCKVRTSTDVAEKGLLDCEAAVFLVVNREYQSYRNCPLFPQHKTALMTANSSSAMFAAYRALARQYVSGVADLLRAAIDSTNGNDIGFENAANIQGSKPLPLGNGDCPAI